jgi:hypothetical protein
VYSAIENVLASLRCTAPSVAGQPADPDPSQRNAEYVKSDTHCQFTPTRNLYGSDRECVQKRQRLPEVNALRFEAGVGNQYAARNRDEPHEYGDVRFKSTLPRGLIHGANAPHTTIDAQVCL